MPETTPERRWRRRLALLGSAALLATSCVALVAVLRQPFDETRLFAKALLPIAALWTAAAALRKDGRRQVAFAAIAALMMPALIALCLGVYGVPWLAPVVLPLLALAPPGAPLLAASLALWVAVRRLESRWRLRWEPAPALHPAGIVTAAMEAVYFGGFLLGSAARVGLPGLALVTLAIAASALIRGTRPTRAIVGAAALVAAALWSGSAWIAFMVHLLLLTADPPPRTSPAGRSNPGAFGGIEFAAGVHCAEELGGEE